MAGERVVVIGAGIGGLVSAMLLAARGLAVTVIEKEAAPGGKIRRVPVGGAEIDGGPTVFTLRDVFEELFDAAGARLEDHLALTRTDVLARHAWSEHERLDLFADPQASEDAIGAFAGADAARGYQAFRAASRRVYETLDAPFLRASKVYPPGLMRRIGLARIGDLIAMRPYESLWKVLGEYFPDPRLRQLFGRYATYCGSSPFRAPSTLMLIAHVEAQGVWLIDGGMSALANALERVAQGHGARFRYGARAASIAVERGRAAGVVLADGERIAADRIIVNADPAALATGRFGEATRRAVPACPPHNRSLSALVWVLQARQDGFPLDRHNVFFSRDYPAEFADLAAGRSPTRPSVYVCALDRGGAASAPTGSERFQIIVNAPPDGDTKIRTAAERDTCTRRMFERLHQCGLTLTPASPPLLATPADFEALCPSTGGALYGRASHGWAASFLRQSARTRIAGLYCAGGSTHPGAGVPMAALSGRLASAMLLADLASTARSRPVATPGGISTRSPARTASEAASG